MRSVWSLMLAVLGTACSKEIVVGADLPGDAATDASDAGAILNDAGLEILVVPWSTGFESGNFDDWSEPSGEGTCYETTGATRKIVTSPVHTGRYAAAFTVDTTIAAPSQSRCVRQGVLPPSAYYGAWYYVPAVETSFGTWNLFHFQGANSPDAAATLICPSGANSNCLWDVSLINQADASIAPSVYDFLRARPLEAGAPIPIGKWFHLEVRFNRSAESTGEFAVYVDSDVVLDLTELETDDTAWGQWFVGNYATSLLPAPSTVYVDDVTIDLTGP